MALQRPSKIDVYKWLAGRKAVIAHFSNVAKGDAEGQTYNPDAYYPSDLKRVIEGRIDGSLPCSVIIPTDELNVLTGAARTVGSIGLALGMKHAGSLVGAYPHDDGTQMERFGSARVRSAARSYHSRFREDDYRSP
jgi:hypothetical protein